MLRSDIPSNNIRVLILRFSKFPFLLIETLFKDNISLKETTLISTFKEISHNYYLNEQDNILLANQDSKISLPSANSVKGKKFTILTEQISEVDIIAKTGEFIDSTQSITLSAFQSVLIISTGTNWRILSLR